MEKHLRCPDCGGKELQISSETQINTKGKNYSAGQGCLGFLVFGPLGLLCGSCGKGQTVSSSNVSYWNCPKCGKKFMTFDCYENEINKLRKHAKTLPFLGCILLIPGLYFFFKIGPVLPTLIYIIASLPFFFPKLSRSYKQAEALEDELYTLKYKMENFTDK